MACIKCGNIYEGRVQEVVGDSVRIQDVGLARLSFGDYPRVGQTVLYYDCKGRRYVLPENDLGALLPPPEDTRRDGVFVRRRLELFDPWEVPVERVFQYLQDDYVEVDEYNVAWIAATTNTMLQVPWIPRGKNILAPPVQLPEGTATQYDYARDGDGKIVTDEDGNPTFIRTNTVMERFWFAPRTFDGVTLDVDAMPSAQFIETGAVWDDTANGVVPWAWGIKDGKCFVRLPFLPMMSVIDYYELQQSVNPSMPYQRLHATVLSLLARQGYGDDELYRPVTSGFNRSQGVFDYRRSFEISLDYSSVSGWQTHPCEVFAAFESGLRENVGSVLLGSFNVSDRTYYQVFAGTVENQGVFLYRTILDSYFTHQTFNGLHFAVPSTDDIIVSGRNVFDFNLGLQVGYEDLKVTPFFGSIFRRMPRTSWINGSPVYSDSLLFVRQTAYVTGASTNWTNTLYYYGENEQSPQLYAHLTDYNKNANIYEGDYGVIPVPESGSGVTVFCGLEINRAWANFCADMCVYGKDVYGVLLSPDMRVKITKLSQDANFSQTAPLVYDAPLAEFLDDNDALTAMTTYNDLTFTVTTTHIQNRTTLYRDAISLLHVTKNDSSKDYTVPVIDTQIDFSHALPVATYTIDRSDVPSGLYYLSRIRLGQVFTSPYEPVYLPPLTPAPQQHYRPLLDPRPSEKPADTPADEWEFDKRRMYPQPTAVLSTTAGRVYVGVKYENGTAPLKWQAPKNGVRYED